MARKSFSNIMKKGFFDLFIVWKDEFMHVITDAGVLIFFLVAPLGYPLLYCCIYNNEVAKEVPMVVVDESNSSRSREFTRLCDATRDVKVVGRCANMSEAEAALNEKKAYGIMLIPKDFNKNIVRGEKSYVMLYTNMSSLLYYKAFLATLTEVSLEMNEDIQISKMASLTDRQQEVEVTPLTYEHVTYFNPQSGFASFLIPAVLVLIIQQTLLMGISLLVGAARDRNTFRNLVPIQNHYRGTFRIVFGKTFCYLTFYAIVSVYLLWVVPRLFDLPQMGDRLTVALFMLPFLLSCIFFSMTLSAFVRDRESSFVIFIFLSLILIFASGISWPASAVPAYWKAFSYVFPSTFGIHGFVKMNTMGATLHDVGFEYLSLWVLTFVYFITACLVYRWQILRSERIYQQSLQKSTNR